MILYGKTFPYFILASGIINEEFNSGTLDSWITLDHSKIVPYTEVVISADGSITYERDTDYEMDYTNGKIKCLSTGSMDSNTDYRISYDYTCYEKQLTKHDGLKLDMYFGLSEAEELIAQSGKIYRPHLGWRLFIDIELFEYDTTALSDFFRMLYSWPTLSGSRTIYCWPRPGYLGGYKILTTNNFQTEYIVDKWFGILLKIGLKSQNTFDNLPSHSGKDNADIETDIPWI